MAEVRQQKNCNVGDQADDDIIQLNKNEFTTLFDLVFILLT